MYNPKTKDQILSDMLLNIGEQYDKTPGYIPRDLSSATAIEIEQLYDGLNQLMDSVDVDKMIGDALAKYISQRKGLIRKPSEKAVGQVLVKGTGRIKIGDLFETENGIQFESIEVKEIVVSDTVKIRAILGGAQGNSPIASITLIPITLQGITSVSNTSVTAGGYDCESDDELRERYYHAIRVPATSGNKYHYQLWACQCVGVGDSRIIPLWNGANTVKIILIDSNKQVASQALIDSVQLYIDPKGSNWGTGSGVAPIGSYCTVASASAKNLTISVSVTKDSNYTPQQIKDNITLSIANYLKTIAFKQSYVSYAKIGNTILDSLGVLDYTNLLVNSGVINVVVLDSEVAIAQTITITFV